ncbi:hypothetical protein VVDAL79087_04245 [Vibrio vulnificus]|nr:hypothetical protein VVDAL79087_04245 [Vibrio vulnificus]SUQ34541.1 Uncharacterised protein [Vibrio vulnificus]
MLLFTKEIDLIKQDRSGMGTRAHHLLIDN